MQKRIAALCSVALFSAGVASTAAIAQNAPVSRITESSAPSASSAAQPSAQSPSAAPVQAAPGASANITDEKLQKFVASAQEVAVLTQQYTQRLNGVSDQASQQQVVQEANQRMEQAIQANGLTVQEFNGISDAVERDPALSQRAQQMLR